MRRRQFLAATCSSLGVALAGCSDPVYVELRLTPLHEADLGERLVTTVDDLGDPEASAVRRAHEDGSDARRASDEDDPLLDDGTVVRYDGEVFAVRTYRVDVEQRTLQTFDVTYTGRGDNTTVELDNDASVVAYADLPAADRAMFDEADPGRLASAGSARSAHVRQDYPDDADSVFFPEHTYDAVEYEGRTFLVEYDGRFVDENATFRYELEPLAPDVRTYVDRVVDEYRFPLDRTALSEAQREMVTTAVDEGEYVEEREISDAFEALLERIQSHDHVDSSFGERAYVLQYDGASYLAVVDGPDYDSKYTTTEPYRTTTDDGDETTATTTAGTATNGTRTDGATTGTG